MRIGILGEESVARLDWIRSRGFGSLEWNRFQESSIALAPETEWRSLAEKWGDEIQSRSLKLSAIGAIYCNAMAPAHQENVRGVMLRAIDVAALLGVKTVACFSGAVIETYENPRRGSPSEKMFDEFIPEICRYWKPIAQTAAQKGVRIAFENCPQGPYRLPIMGCNLMAQPANWSKVFHEIDQENIGLEWDPSHLICQGIDPVENLKEFGSRVFHVHAKDAELQHDLIRRYGRCHPEAARHRFPGMGEANWKEILQSLREVEYDSDLTIEGWHDPIYKGEKEEEGLLFAKAHLEQWI